MQTWQEYDRCIRCATFEELSTASASRRAANVSRMYRETLDRNAVISRRMRADKNEPRLQYWEMPNLRIRCLASAKTGFAR